MGKGIPRRAYTKGKSRRVTIQGSQSNLRSAAREGLGPLLVLVYVNAIWRNIDSNIRPSLTTVCIIYRKNTNKKTEKLEKDLDTLGEWEVENGMKINLAKSKTIRFTTARVKNPLGYSLGDQRMPEANVCKYLGIILRRDLNWVDLINYTAKKPGRHFTL